MKFNLHISNTWSFLSKVKQRSILQFSVLLVSAHWNLRQYLNIYISKTLYCCFLPSELIRSCNLGQSIGYLKYGEKKSCWPVNNLTLQKINDNVWMVYSYMSHKSKNKICPIFFLTWNSYLTKWRKYFQWTLNCWAHMTKIVTSSESLMWMTQSLALCVRYCLSDVDFR